MKIITKREDVEKYFNSERVNQSTLKDLTEGLQPFLDKRAKRKNQVVTPSYFIFGQAVETLLEEGEEAFKANFYVSELSGLPSDTEIEITEKVHERAKELSFLNEAPVSIEFLHYKVYIEKEIKEKSYYSNRKMETNINNIVDKCSQYFKELVLSEGKNIVSTEEKSKIDNTVKSLRESPNTAKYFSDFYDDNPNLHIYFQLPLYFSYRGVECKALLDMVVVETDDDNNAISIEIIDLKTLSGYTLDFPSSARKFRYDIQAGFYSLAIVMDDLIVPEGFPTISEKTEYLPFKFLVESSTSPGTPLVFTTDDSFIYSGIRGERSPTGKWYKYGVNYLIDYYKYLKSKDWKSERVVEENNGILTLTSEGILEMKHD